MTKAIIIILFCGLFTFNLNAQKLIKKSDDYKFNTYHKNIYVELLGSHINYGVNFDMRLTRGQMDGSGFRAGIGYAIGSGIFDNTNPLIKILTFPLEYNYLIGSHTSSLLLGAGLLPIYVTVPADNDLSNNKYVSKKGIGLGGGFLSIGYRYQPKDSGFMMQINWSPILFSTGEVIPSWAGLGIGYGFK